MAKRYDPIMCMLVDEPTKAQDADPIAALSNFKKTAEYGDSIKIDIGKGKTAIVQKEANGWYATIGNEKVKGTFNVIAGYLKSASAKDSKAQDESYIVRGRKYKVVKRDGDNVTVIGPDGKVTKMDIHNHFHDF